MTDRPGEGWGGFVMPLCGLTCTGFCPYLRCGRFSVPSQFFARSGLNHMHILTYTDARNALASTMDRVVQDRDIAVITRTGREGVVMIAQGEWDSLQETLHLLSSPRNASILRASIDELNEGGGDYRELLDEAEILKARVD